MKEIDIMEVGGFSIGHAQNEEAGTGCTVLLCDDFSPAGSDVRGGGPATRDAFLLNPLTSADGINAVFLSGGSAYGLDAAGGVMRYLEERGIGFDTGFAKVPLVPQSCLYDLAVGSATVRPDAAMAYEACKNASKKSPAQGNVGAGTGCTVGKLYGLERCIKSGFGTYAIESNGVKVGVLVAVNAFGDIFDPEGKQIGGLLNKEKNGFVPTSMEMILNGNAENLFLGTEHENTTLGIIVTNCRFSKSQLCKIAGMTHNAYARSIRPVHTTADGDTIYAVSTGNLTADINMVSVMATYAMQRAIVNSITKAKSAYGLKDAASILAKN